MRNFFLASLALCCLCVQTVQANDPFDKAQRQKTNAENSTLKQSHFCHKNQPAIASDIPFQQLKVVGVIKSATFAQVLWLDPLKQLHSAQQDDFIGQEKLQLKHIETKEIQLLSWENTANCNSPKTLSIQY